jgi:hypothetical protein
MDRKNRVKMLINKLWKTRQIQAAFGMQAFQRVRTGRWEKSRSVDGGAGEIKIHSGTVHYSRYLLKTGIMSPGFC